MTRQASNGVWIMARQKYACTGAVIRWLGVPTHASFAGGITAIAVMVSLVVYLVLRARSRKDTIHSGGAPEPSSTSFTAQADRLQPVDLAVLPQAHPQPPSVQGASFMTIENGGKRLPDGGGGVLLPAAGLKMRMEDELLRQRLLSRTFGSAPALMDALVKAPAADAAASGVPTWSAGAAFSTCAPDHVTTYGSLPSTPRVMSQRAPSLSLDFHASYSGAAPVVKHPAGQVINACPDQSVLQPTHRPVSGRTAAEAVLARRILVDGYALTGTLQQGRRSDGGAVLAPDCKPPRPPAAHACRPGRHSADLGVIRYQARRADQKSPEEAAAALIQTRARFWSQFALADHQAVLGHPPATP